MSVAEISAKLDVSGLMAKGHRVLVQACSCRDNVGLQQGMQWLVDTLALPNAGRHTAASGTGPDAVAVTTVDDAQQPLSAQEQLLREWLEREDSPDDVFLQEFNTYTLDKWDHYTHLRVAWLLLTRHGRQQGMDLIFNGIQSFIQNSPRTQRSDTGRGTTFHQTMTYFWVHMVHYAIESSNRASLLSHNLALNPLLNKFATGHALERSDANALQMQAAGKPVLHSSPLIHGASAGSNVQKYDKNDWAAEEFRRERAAAAASDDLERNYKAHPTESPPPPPPPPPSANGMHYSRTKDALDSNAVPFAAKTLELHPFKRFLLLNPVLSNGGYFLEFYSRERILLDPTARSQVCSTNP
jgi:hypothetical protein